MTIKTIDLKYKVVIVEKGSYRSSSISEVLEDSSTIFASQGRVLTGHDKFPGLYISERILINIRGAKIVITATAKD